MSGEPDKIGLIVGTDDGKRYIRRDPWASDSGKKWSTPDWSQEFDWDDIESEDLKVFGTI